MRQAVQRMLQHFRVRVDLPTHWLRQAIVPRALRARRVRRRAATSGGSRRTLYIDLAVISVEDAGTGIQRVVRGLAHALVRQKPPGWDIQFIAASRTQRYHPIVWPGPRDRTAGPAIRARAGDVFVGLDYALDTVRWHRRQLSRFRRDGGRIWFLVHDMLPAQRPDWFSPYAVLRNRAWLDILAALGDGFLCNSHQTEADLIAELRRYGLFRHAYQTCVLPMGYDISEAMQEAEPGGVGVPARIRALDGKPFFLKVGRLEPRKGHADLLQAFDILWSDGFDQMLVLIGQLGWRVDALRKTILAHPEYGRRLFWLEDVADAELIEIYQASEGVLVASLGEGFGLPLIEALGHGRPVLARDLPIFRQHAPNGVQFFPAEATPDVLADHILQWRKAIRDGAVVVQPPQTGWQEAARILLAAVTV